ncbi:MAG TPA: hypothetical protein VHW60_22460 [Caulobacteraceae bacterium]|jgi:hypothetical protein|nr:hypothetical protein [Caulobacteraceae bacterium]
MKLKIAASCGAALLACALIAVGTPALAKTARCVIKTSDGAPYQGPCKFQLDPGGTFTVTPIGRDVFFPEILAISVEIDGDNTDVRGLTTAGINSSWGSAHRSTRDRACWVGADFSVCVY